jgi:predicted aspartyl protease
MGLMAVSRAIVVLASLATMASGCVHPGADASPRLAAVAPANANGSAAGPLPRRATFAYRIRGRDFPLPVIAGTVAGERVLMFLDTGANSHVLAGWLARRLHLPMRGLGDVGADHVGKAVAAYRIEHPAMTIDGWGELSADTVLATDFPDVIEKLGVGAFISPQQLAGDGSVLFDLRRGELRSDRWAALEPELDGETTLVGPSGAERCEDDGPVRGLAFVVPAEIEHRPVRLLVDSGAQHSDIFLSSDAGKQLAAQSSMIAEPLYTAGGKVTGRQLNGAHVTAGTLSTVTTVGLVGGNADRSCPRDGVLGMDILRSCALLFGRSGMLARCASARDVLDHRPHGVE